MALKFLLSFGVLFMIFLLITPSEKEASFYYHFVTNLGGVSFVGLIISLIWLIWEKL